MNLALRFMRILFVVISVFVMTAYQVGRPEGYTVVNAALGVGAGLLLGAALIGFDLLFKQFNLRTFNIAVVGIFCGYLMGRGLVLILSTVLDISAASVYLSPQVLEVSKIILFLFGVYLGTLTALRAADEFYVSIPFVKFSVQAHKKKDLLLDASVLADARIIDLAASGLLDHHLILPRFLIKDLHSQADAADDGIRTRAKRSLEVVKKLEATPGLNLRYHDADFPDLKDLMSKTVHLARLLDAHILTADISRMQTSSIEGVRIINLDTLSNALKPLMQAGEQIRIKIQRYGKEPRQGVGYLENGTMVVVNGGGQYIGEAIDVRVLSVKHTASGRMVFCNAVDETQGEYSHVYRDDQEEQ